MTKEMPGSLKAALKNDGYEAKAWACADLGQGTDCGECSREENIYTVLTQDSLLIYKAQRREKCRTYSGYFEKRAHMKAAIQPETPVLGARYMLSSLGNPKTENLVAGGCLTVEKDGVRHLVCVFSGQYLRPMTRFCASLEKVCALNGAEDKPQDGGAPRPSMPERHGGPGGPGGPGGLGGPGGPGGTGDEEDDEVPCCPKCGMPYPERDRRICPHCMDRRSVFMRVLGYFAPFKKQLIIMMIAVLLGTAMSLALPYLSGTLLFDRVLSENEAAAAFLERLGIPGQYMTALWIVAGLMLAAKLVQTLFTMVQGRIVASIVPKVMKNIKTSIFDSLGRLSVSFFARRQTGGLMTRINGDANEVMGFFIDGLPFVFTHGAYIICSMIIMFTLSWKLALVSVVLVPALFYVGFMMMPTLWHYYGRRHRANRSLNAQINDNLTGARVVKAFGREEEEVRRFQKGNSRMRRAELDLVDFDNRYYALFVTVEQLAQMAVWIIGSIMLLGSGEITYGVLVSFVGYVSGLSNPLDFMSFAMRWWTDSMNSAQRIFEILDAVPEVTEKPDAIELKDIKGQVEMRNVCFSYEPNKPVLKNISFTAPAGKMLGIVGHSGAGKSTIVNLISRLYDATEGQVLIDGINVKDVTVASLRRSVAMVSQETYIFMGSVAQNIAYARPDASDEEIVAAAKAASAHEFIMRMPEGYNTLIGASGRSLSGGERQRISIARAILADPKILILDEATASVDTETERSIQDAIDRLVVGRTTISIAHRLSTLRAADRLIVIENGEVAESGTHAELARAKGVYFRLLQLQSKALSVRGLDNN